MTSSWIWVDVHFALLDSFFGYCFLPTGVQLERQIADSVQEMTSTNKVCEFCPLLTRNTA